MSIASNASSSVPPTTLFQKRYGLPPTAVPAASTNTTSATSSRQRVTFQVGYLTSFSYSANATVLHVFQCAEPHRVAIGVPARRVLILADEKGFDMDFEALIRHCAAVSNVVEVCLLPSEAAHLVHRPDGTSAPLNDCDVFLQQSSQLDFIRTIGALFRPVMSGGAPPVFELDEAQPWAPSINCHQRLHPLRNAVIDGISKEALRVISEDHSRQLRYLQSKITDSRTYRTEETVEFLNERDAFRREVERLQRELARAHQQLREERDAAKVQLAQVAEDLRKSREELMFAKLLRFQNGLEPEGTPVPPSRGAEAATPNGALQRLRAELAENENYISRLRSRSTSKGSV